MIKMIEWINLICLCVSCFLMGYLYKLSIEPMKREETRGEKAWEECRKFRVIAGYFEGLIILNIILWIWIPVPGLTWPIYSDLLMGIIIFLIITIPCTIIMMKGVKDAGKESLQPSKETKMHGGIYNHIRHPQTTGEFPLFVAVAVLINSWFLVIIMIIWIILYSPIIMYYEEKDLIRRFGDEYREYQKRTGAFIPKIRKK